jgi:hypothetical protein
VLRDRPDGAEILDLKHMHNCKVKFAWAA